MYMQYTVQAMHKNEYFMSNEYLIMVIGSTNHKGIREAFIKKKK